MRIDIHRDLRKTKNILHVIERIIHRGCTKFLDHSNNRSNKIYEIKSADKVAVDGIYIVTYI